MVPVWAGQGLHQPPSPLSSPAREHEGFRAGQWSSEGTDQQQKCHLFRELFLFQTHNSGYYTRYFTHTTKDKQHGNRNKQQEHLKPKLLPREEFVRLHLRQGISITLDFFLSSLASTWHTQTRAQALSYQNKSRHSVLNINSQIANKLAGDKFPWRESQYSKCSEKPHTTCTTDQISTDSSPVTPALLKIILQI